MKTKYFESKPGTLVCALTGSEYKYKVSDKNSRQDAIQSLSKTQATELAAMQKRQPELSARQHFFPATIPHPETRSADELKAKRAAEARKAHERKATPTTAAPVNPFETTIEAEIRRHNPLWETSYPGRRVIANLKRQSKEWEAEQERKREQTALTESVKPAVDHATNVLAELQRNPNITVTELEQAQARVGLARDGKLTEYAAADREWRDTQRKKLEDAAVEVDSQIRTLAAKRDAILKSAYEPVNESAEPQLVPVSYPSFYHDPAKAGKTIMEPMPQGV